MDILAKLEVLQANSGALPEFYDNRFEHTRERMAERYNIQITREDWQKLNLKVFTDAPTTRWVDIGDTSASSLYMVEYAGESMMLAFSETAYAVMTVFPRSDMRMLHLRQNTYIQRARTAGDTAFRDARQAVAADVANMVLDGSGNLVKPGPVLEKEPPVEPPKYQPFKDALAGFKPAPKPERPLLTVVSKTVVPTDDPDVMAAFAALKRHLDDADQGVASDDEADEEEVRQLEQRIAEIRAGSLLAQMKREYLDSSRRLAEQAFGKFRDGVFTSEAALSFVRLLSAQQTEVERPRLTAQELVSRQARGLEGVAAEGPDAVVVQDGRAYKYRLDGIEDTIDGWARRAGISAQAIKYRTDKLKLSFREAVTMKPLRNRG